MTFVNIDDEALHKIVTRMRRRPFLNLVEGKLYQLKIDNAVREMNGKHGPQEVIDITNMTDGKQYCLPLRTVLKNRIHELQLQPGEEFGVINLGKR